VAGNISPIIAKVGGLQSQGGKGEERLLDKFFLATGIPNGLVGKNGEVITKAGWVDACDRFHRAILTLTSVARRAIWNSCGIYKTAKQHGTYAETD
jgi:hypothetical protein